MKKTAIVVPLAAAMLAAAPWTSATETNKPVQVAQASGGNAEAKDKGKKTEAAKTPETRNWADVDTNKDGLIAPEEMAAYLKANPGPLAPK